MILEQPKQHHYDVVIIGSGPAGISTAMKLAENSSAKIAIIESGSTEAHEKVQELARVQLSGELQDDYFPMHTQRCFGGSSTIWGGFCATLEERAFLAQEWPIEYRELMRWYPQATEMLELPEAAYKRAAVPIAGSDHIVYRPFYLSPPVRFNQKYRSFIEQHPNIHLVLNTTCSRLLTQGNDVVGAQVRTTLGQDDATATIKAERFVLACGGVGNPRMMQISEVGKDLPVGVGLMEHPHLYGVANIYLNRKRVEQVVEKKAHVVHALQLSSEYCLANGLQSFSADFNLEKAVKEPILGATQDTILTPVSVRAEMAPHPENTVTLSEQKDFLGQPLPKVDFKFRCEEPANLCWQRLSEELLRSGLGRPSTLAVDLKPDGGGHLIGTTPMGSTKADSVVDSDSRVHGSNNLFVAGSSVFPAGGASNPTYTIVALSLRLGDHLAKTIKG